MSREEEEEEEDGEEKAEAGTFHLSLFIAQKAETICKIMLT